MYRIITDTSANLELELLERRGIAEIPFSFSIPEKGGDALYCPDFSAFDSKAFYDAMRSGTRVTTSQITPAQYTEKMRPLLEAGQDILFYRHVIRRERIISGRNGGGGSAARRIS